jgi:chorismate dehydratase
MPYRLAAVSFLNTVPLIEWFAATGDPRVWLERTLPSRLAEVLTAGRADAALLPTVEIFRHGCDLLGATGIACLGPVDSVVLFHRNASRGLRGLSRVEVDRGSRTSVALLRLLLAEAGAPAVEFVEFEPSPGHQPGPGGGVLVIGDRCLQFDRWRREDPAGEGIEALDLGQAWFELTGLPFVFAAWAATPGLPGRLGEAGVAELAGLLTDAREYGISHLDGISAREAANGSLGCGGVATVEALQQYFGRSLRFRLGEAELEGMSRFHAMCLEHRLAPPGERPRHL